MNNNNNNKETNRKWENDGEGLNERSEINRQSNRQFYDHKDDYYYRF